MINIQYSHLSTSRKKYFNTEKEIQKYHLNVSTFDVINVNSFRNHRLSTIFCYFYMWTLVFLSFVLLATDIYTCINMYLGAFTKDGYRPYAYPVSKWVFTGCLIFQFLLLIYRWIWAIYIFRTKNIALVYLNSLAKKLYSIRSYDYFCLLNKINGGRFEDWGTFFIYYELDGALQILVADTPRQVINVLTLQYYTTAGNSNINILANIETIAKTNLHLSIVLGFICLSVVIYSIFMFRFLFAMIFYIPFRMKLTDNHYNSLKEYCYRIVNADIQKVLDKQLAQIY